MNTRCCPVLVVDDTPDTRLTICEILTLAGFPSETAKNGRDALKKQAATPFSLIITDVLMPDCDGLELIQQITKQYPNTPIICITGGGQMGLNLTLKVASQLGACQVLAKPFRSEALLAAVDKALMRVSVSA